MVSFLSQHILGIISLKITVNNRNWMICYYKPHTPGLSDIVLWLMVTICILTVTSRPAHILVTLEHAVNSMNSA